MTAPSCLPSLWNGSALAISRSRSSSTHNEASWISFKPKALLTCLYKLPTRCICCCHVLPVGVVLCSSRPPLLRAKALITMRVVQLCVVLALLQSSHYVAAQNAGPMTPAGASKPAPTATPAAPGAQGPTGSSTTANAAAAKPAGSPAGIISSQDAVDTSAPIDVELIFSGELLMGCREGGETCVNLRQQQARVGCDCEETRHNEQSEPDL